MRPAKHEPRPGLTLVELIIVCAIIGTLAAIIVPAAAEARHIALRVGCVSNLRQIGLATAMYLKDNDGMFFPIRQDLPEGVLWYYGFEPAGSASRGEGRRLLDRTRGLLYPYLEAPEGVEVCPAFDYDGAYKPKYQGRWWTYGVNARLAGLPTCHSILEIRPRDMARTVLFADSAWVNTFQAPASPKNPLIEEWFYIQPSTRYVHFRHGGQANVLFADWHIEACDPAPGSFDPRLPAAKIGYLDGGKVVFSPRRGK